MLPVCQCSSCRPVISTHGYSRSGCSAARISPAGTSRALPVAVGKRSVNTTGAPGSPSCPHGQDTEGVLAMVREFRAEDRDTPVVLMGYYNPLLAYGVERFCAAAASAGARS